MIRILGHILNNKQRIDIALTAIYGLGKFRSTQILQALKISPVLKVYQVTSEQFILLRNKLELSTLVLESDLRRRIRSHIKRLTEINCFRGVRHRKGLPVRGQRSRTNCQTTRRLYSR